MNSKNSEFVPASTDEARPQQLLTFSAPTAAGLSAATAALFDYLRRHREANLADLAYTLQTARRPAAYRRALVCADVEDALLALESRDPQRLLTALHTGAARPVVFAFPGGGAQHVKMGAGLYRAEPFFRETVDRCAEYLTPHLGLDLRALLYPDDEHLAPASEQIQRPSYVLAALFVTEYALAALLIYWGLRPKAMLGQSLGEYVAACHAGVISLEDALAVVALRGRLFETIPKGAMLSVPLSESELRPLLDEELSLAAINAPSHCVVSGRIEAIDDFEKTLASKGHEYRRLQVSGAGHSHLVTPFLKEFSAFTRHIKQRGPKIPYISNVTGTWITRDEIRDPDYWPKHLRQTVRLAEGAAEILKDTESAILEVGPGRALTTLLRQYPEKNPEQLLLTTMRHPQGAESDGGFLLNCLGRLWLAGVRIDWKTFYARQRRSRLRLPRVASTLRREGDAADLEAIEAAAKGERQTSYVAPRTELERRVALIWQELFSRQPIGVHDNFFELGGHSLLATRLFSRVRDSFGVVMSIQTLLEQPTLDGMSRHIEAAIKAGDVRPDTPLKIIERDGPLPLSYSQESLWLLDQMEPGNPFYNALKIISLTGRLNEEALRRALDALVARHESLRTSFVALHGAPRQLVHPPATPPLARLDLSHLDAPDRLARAEEAAREHARLPFDLAAAPLLRLLLVRLDATQHLLAVTMHHIISDGWSLAIFFDELSRLYEAELAGGEAGLAPLPVQYVDYAAWQRAALTTERLAGSLSYWRARLAGAAAAMRLPADRERPAVQRFRGARLGFTVAGGVRGALEAVAREAGATPYVVLLAAFKVLLYRYTGEADVVVGTPVAGRGRAEVEGVIGFFINMLAVRTAVDGGLTAREVIGRVKEGALGGQAHQEVPFEKVVEEVRPERSLSHSPIFQVVFAFQNVPKDRQVASGLKFGLLEVDSKTSKFDLTLFMWQSEQGLTGVFEYNTDMFEEATVARLARHFQTLLQHLPAHLDLPVARLPLLDDEERRLILDSWNRTSAPYPHQRLMHDLVVEQARRDPAALAVECGGERLSYGQLDERSATVAAQLRARGIGAERRVVVWVPRGVAMVVAWLGVLRAGGAYVPLDVGLPRQRVEYVVKDAEAGVVIAAREACPVGDEAHGSAVSVLYLDLNGELAANETGDLVEIKTDDAMSAVTTASARVTSENLAYVIYTSGSTGQPKGVAVSHRSLLNLVCWHLSAYRPRPSTRASQLASPGFDAAAWEVWPYLAAGASLHLPDEATVRAPAELARWLAAARVQIGFAPTPLAEALLGERWPEASALRVLLTGGDRLRRRPRAGVGWRLVNHYGPTEHTVVATCADVAPETSDGREGAESGEGQPRLPAIGRGIANTRLYVLGRAMEVVPVGARGELYLGGESLARGYVGDAARTAERFVPDPFSQEPGGRLYRTGDLCRWAEGGELEYVGREDGQVKVRGYRIELGEVEAALRGCAGVREAAVEAVEEGGERRLVGYVEWERGAERGAGRLRGQLKGVLPEHMVPARYAWVERMPLTPNGKLDRKALLARFGTEEANGKENYIAPRTPLEETVATIWSDSLGLNQVGVTDSFFDLGGHSLLAMSVLSRLREHFQLDLPLRSMFESPTVAGLSSIIEQLQSAATEHRIGPIRKVNRESPDEILARLDELSQQEIDSLLSLMLEQ